MKSVLITGGSGSFGNAFVRRLLETQAERIVVYSRDEQKQETMAGHFSVHPRYDALRFFIGDVRDVDRLSFAMHGIDTVVHAAALKIVPTLEYNPTEAIATNIVGSENVVKASIRAGVSKAIALSTDKAVNPVNLYGATKLAMEKIFIAANALAGGTTLFSVVRYGNVVGSRGSVIPLFKRLAAEGKPLTLTDQRMTRFWITLDEAISLVFVCHKTMIGREIFVPKIPSMRVVDLARAISGNEFWMETGIRPGEKLHEVLITEDESRNGYDNGQYYRLVPSKKGYSFDFLKALKPLPEGFRYTSNGNEDWLSAEDLKVLIQ